jgi:RND family efflux transporter MFP subunit
MVTRYPSHWRRGVLVAVTGMLCGCNPSAPSVVETPPPPVTVSQPLVREVIDYDDYDGRIAAVETVEERARVRGHLLKVNFEDGQVVKQGDLLFEIDPGTYKSALDVAEAQIKVAEAKLKQSQAEVKRNEPLVAKGAVTRAEFDKYVADAEMSAASVNAHKASAEAARLDLGFTKIVAPISGKTSRTLVTVGNLVNAGGGETLLTTITSVDPMYVYFDVDERAISRYRRVYRKDPVDAGGAQPTVKDLKIPVAVALEGEEGHPHQGVLDFVDNRVNPSTGTIQVRGVLPNPKRILDAGMRARVRIPIGDPHKAILVTERAVGNDQGRKFLYVVNDQDVVERRDVKLDRLSDGLQVIKEGLKAEDWVIVNGIQRVRDAMKVAPKRSPMPAAATPNGAKSEPTKSGAKS